MKKLSVLLAIFTLFFFSGCQIIGDIFKAGMGFGIFLVVVFIAIIGFVLAKAFGGGK